NRCVTTGAKTGEKSSNRAGFAAADGRLAAIPRSEGRSAMRPAKLTRTAQCGWRAFPSLIFRIVVCRFARRLCEDTRLCPLEDFLSRRPRTTVEGKWPQIT